MDDALHNPWLIQLVGSLGRALRSAELGNLLAQGACEAAHADAAWLTCSGTEVEPAAPDREWIYPLDHDPLAAQSRSWGRIAVPLGGTLGGRLEVARALPFVSDETDSVTLIAQLAGLVLGRVIALEEQSGAERRFRTLVEQLPLAIYIDALDDGATSMYNNPANELITGHSDKEWRADPHLFSKILHPDDRDRVLKAFADARETNEPVSTEYRIVRRDGSQVWVRDQAVVVHDEHGRPEHVQGYLLDITRQRSAEHELARQAFRDPVTGLPNRRCFDERFEIELAAASERSDTLAIMFIDLDNFKQVNDRHGHETGDALLRTAAASLRTALRDCDFLARLGGDEFVALIPHLPLDLDHATRAAIEIATRLLTAARVDNGQRIPISASIGIALWPHHAQAGGSILRQADASMYQAKQAGRNRFQLAG